MMDKKHLPHALLMVTYTSSHQVQTIKHKFGSIHYTSIISYIWYVQIYNTLAALALQLND